jgi:hypothetical protein
VGRPPAAARLNCLPYAANSGALNGKPPRSLGPCPVGTPLRSADRAPSAHVASRRMVPSTSEGSALSASETSATELYVRTTIDEILYDGSLTSTCFQPLPSKDDELINLGGGNCTAYGDTDVDVVLTMFEEARGHPVTSFDSFCDLGSGNARLVLSVSLLTQVARSVGVELTETRHAQAQAALAECERRGLPCGRVQLCCANMLEHDLSSTTMVFHYNVPDEAFLWQLKRHLVCSLPAGAAILLRKEQLPPVIGQRGFEAHSSSWSVTLCPNDVPSGDGISTPRNATLNARVKRLQPVLQTRLMNRMFNFYVYRVVETPVQLTLPAEQPSDPPCDQSLDEIAEAAAEATVTRGELGGSGDAAAAECVDGFLPAAADLTTARALSSDARIREALRQWMVEHASGDASHGHGASSRVLPLAVCTAPLGTTRHQRSMLVPPARAAAEECDSDDMSGWELE